VIRASAGSVATPFDDGGGSVSYGDAYLNPLNVNLLALGVSFYIKLAQDPGSSVGWQVGLTSNGVGIGIGSSNRRLNGSKYYVLPFTAFPTVDGDFRLDDVDKIGLQFDFYGLPAVTVAVTEFGIVPKPPESDFDGNSVVNAVDLALWRANFGKKDGATRAQGDADGDADVDGGDFLKWQVQLGLSTSSPSAAIPAPTSTIPLFVAAAALWVVNRRPR
jgi:hypothetical protein